MNRLTNKQTIIQKILENTPDEYEALVMKAVRFAKLYHDGEIRYSGEDFVVHALNVALLVSEIRMDTSSVIAGMFHQIISQRFKSPEVIENTRAEIQSIFGDEILTLVDQMEELNQATKINKFDNTEILTRYMLSSSTDIRPLIIKICDITEELKTIEYIPKDKIRGFCKKVLDVYSPLAEYMNFFEMKTLLEENAFKLLDPESYEHISKKLEEFGIDEGLLDKYIDYLKTITETLDFEAQIKGRVKGKYSIHKKFKKYLDEGKSGSINELRDLLAFSVITMLVKQCHKVSSALKTLTEESPEHFDDYISFPKPNGFKAIQMTTRIPEISQLDVEIQILTDDMYYYNTYGPASHIAYKASKKRNAKEAEGIDWIQQIHENISEHINLREKRISIPITGEIFRNQIFAFTPQGLIIELEEGSSVIDFAYKVHTKIGHGAIGAKINGKTAQLSSHLQTGDIVEIISQKGKNNPSPDWISFARSETTKRHIKNALRKNNKF